LTRAGPTIGKPIRLLSRRPFDYQFSPLNRFVVYQDHSTIFAVPLDKPNGQPFEVVRFENSYCTVHVLDKELTLLVAESVAEQPGVINGADPTQIWWVDHKAGTKKAIRGPEKFLDLCTKPTSPDHRFIAMKQRRETTDGKGHVTAFIFLDRDTKKEKLVEIPGTDLSVIEWKKADSGWRAVVASNRSTLNKKKSDEWYLIDPVTGDMRQPKQGDPYFEIDNPLSPDGAHRVRVEKDELVVTELANGKERRFVFHEDDRRHVGEGCI
jgi:hypothetical protein